MNKITAAVMFDDPKADRQEQTYSAKKNRESSVPAPLLFPVRMPAVHLLQYEARQIRKGRKQADANIALPGKPLQNRRKPKRDPVPSSSRAEVAARQQDDVALHERLPNRVRTNLLLCRFS